MLSTGRGPLPLSLSSCSLSIQVMTKCRICDTEAYALALIEISWCERFRVPRTHSSHTSMVEIARLGRQYIVHRRTTILRCQSARPHGVAVPSPRGADTLERLHFDHNYWRGACGRSAAGVRLRAYHCGIVDALRAAQKIYILREPRTRDAAHQWRGTQRVWHDASQQRK